MAELLGNDGAEAVPLIERAILAYLKAEDAGKALDPSAWINDYPVAIRPALQAFLLGHLRAAQLGQPAGYDPYSTRGGANSPSLSETGPWRSVVSELPPQLKDHSLYEIVRELGRGGMGVVYLARQKKLNRIEVLKVMSERLSSHSDSRLRFEREMKLAASLNHPHVVTAFGTPEAGNLLVFAMEYVDGLDLTRFIREERNGRPLSVQNACLYARQTALGLQNAVEKGLVHRDIKPSNLILARQGKKHTVKITDFGLARARREEGKSTELTGQDVMMGTPDYIAPEQIRDAANTDTRGDIYSLGCTLYFMLTGRAPFQGTSRFDVLEKHVSCQATPLDQIRSDVTPELAALVQKMMAKDPALRFQTPLEVAQALESFVKTAAATTPVGGANKQNQPDDEDVSSPLAARYETLIESRSSTVEEFSWSVPPLRQRKADKTRRVIVASVSAAALLLGLAIMLATGVFKAKTKDSELAIADGHKTTKARVEPAGVDVAKIPPAKGKQPIPEPPAVVVAPDDKEKQGEARPDAPKALPQNDLPKQSPSTSGPVAAQEKKDQPAVFDGLDVDVSTFKEEAAKATNAEAKAMFRDLMVAYDRIEPNFQGGLKYRIELQALRELPEGEFTVRVLDAAMRNSSERKFATGAGFKYTPFEITVLEEVEKFLAKKTSLDSHEQLNYAARAVAAGLRWHLMAVVTNKRVGKEWEPVARQLRDRQLALMQQRFTALVEAKMYLKADEVGLKMLACYPNDNAVLCDVYRLQILRIRDDLKTPSDAVLSKLREAVLLYERLPGKKDEGLIASSRKLLRDRATVLVAEAKELDSKKLTAAALTKLRQADLLDSELPSIADVRNKLRGKVLYVGVSTLPERMSPATAELDSERWTVELMFEGLLQPIAEGEVVRYRPALAESLPEVMMLDRSFNLPRNVRWAREVGGVLDARDVRGTLDLLRRPAYRDRWCGVGLDVFERIDQIGDAFAVRLAYRQNVFEPLGRATFKVLPAQYLLAQGKTAVDEPFARAPFGTGPFRYEGREREDADRECAVFRANPFYGERSGKFGLPLIREIRMFVPSQSSLLADVASGQLHLYPDAPGGLANRLRSEKGLAETMRVQVAHTNRRVHILAVNHRQTDLHNDKVRQGLSAAINRDGILTDVFRDGDAKAHVALTGPFPFRCWATPPSARDAPLYQAGAGGLINEGLNGRRIRLKLIFVKDDPNPINLRVCQLIQKQIQQGSLNKAGKPLVEIDLQALTPEKFHEKLHLEFDYDLALTTFDYRDGSYSLDSLLDPDASLRAGRNYLGYLAPGTNFGDDDRRMRKLIEGTGQDQGITKPVKDKTWEIHTLFNQRVPFIPLWQLDRYMVVHRELEMYLDNPLAPVGPERLDPAVVFTGVEMWKWK